MILMMQPGKKALDNLKEGIDEAYYMGAKVLHSLAVSMRKIRRKRHLPL